MSAMQREGGNGKSGDTLKEDSSMHDKLMFKCRMAENSERFDDMVQFIKEACEKSAESLSSSSEGSAPPPPPLGPNERNFLSVAYKNSVGSRRNALRCLQAMRTKYEARGGSENVKIIDEYYEKIHAEMEKICNEVLGLIDTVILKPDNTKHLKDDMATREFKVFFHKMYADYYRYLAEFTPENSEKKKQAIESASKNYSDAYECATNGAEGVILPPSHPIRLGLCLNYSVFLYEIQGKPEEAKSMAKKAFDDALDNLDSTGELEYKDSTLILQLLRDNTTLWSTQDNEGAAAGSPANPSQTNQEQK